MEYRLVITINYNNGLFMNNLYIRYVCMYVYIYIYIYIYTHTNMAWNGLTIKVFRPPPAMFKGFCYSDL